MMTTAVRKIALTTHITSSVGWLGAVAAFLATIATALAAPPALTVNRKFLRERIGFFWLMPASFLCVARWTTTTAPNRGCLSKPLQVTRLYLVDQVWKMAQAKIILACEPAVNSHSQPRLIIPSRRPRVRARGMPVRSAPPEGRKPLSSKRLPHRKRRRHRGKGSGRRSLSAPRPADAAPQ